MINDYYDLLLSPGKIGSMELKNKIVMPPMVTNFATKKEQYKAYLKERAAGGVGLIILEATYTHPSGKGFFNNLSIDRDELISDLRELTEALHEAGTKVAIQIFHAGRQTSSRITERRLLAPSPIPTPDEEEIPKEMTLEEIREIIESFGEAARRAQAAGFDAVEVHGTHGYLINEFLSPYSNRREDTYGGDFEGRLKFVLEILQVVREKTGGNFPIIYRINGDECVEGGLTLVDAQKIAKRLEAYVDCFHVTAGVAESNYNSIPPMSMPRGCKAYLAAGIKEVVSVPVIAAARINHPRVAEDILSQNKADFVAMGRALICDPELPTKVSKGQTDDLRICIACNQKCIDRLVGAEPGPVSCVLNVRTSRELEFPMRKSASKKNVLIVGAGPAGLEAARVAAIRGHRVELFEKNKEIGGQINLVARVPGREEFKEVIAYYTYQLARSDIKLVLNHVLTAQDVKDIAADVVIFATGANFLFPDLPGVDSAHVVAAWDVLKGECNLGERVVILGGGSVGLSIADLLRRQGKKVSIIEMMNEIASDMESLTRRLFMKELVSDEKVRVWTNTKVVEINDQGITVERGWEKFILKEVDNVVLALGAKSNRDLVDELAGKLRNYYLIGDAKKPRKVTEAIEEGFEVAYRI